MDFLDRTRVRVRSGDGGAGCVSFRREKSRPNGGPDGGDGGRGGDLWAEAIAGLTTLATLRRVRKVEAGNGARGESRDRAGRRGEDRTIQLPAGTVITDSATSDVLADLDLPGKRVLLARGGRGGAGNARFATSTNRAPRRSTPGEKGVEYEISLQLKLLADAGIVGLPNAGKSTFLRAVSNARPKVADYPFTTLHPYLGTVEVGYESFVIADIPGLIHGAHLGIGLGGQFLGHVERCSAMLHLVDASSSDIAGDYSTVLNEVEAYGCGLMDKPRLVALSKVDLIGESDTAVACERLQERGVNEVIPLSAATGMNVEKTLQSLWRIVQQVRE